MKHCPACQLHKSEDEFYQEPKRPGGLSSHCKECRRSRMRRYWKERYYPENRDAHIANVLTRRKSGTPQGD